MDESKIKILEGEDRISTLPNGVLCDILSLLPTKDSVRTSALSTRWRYLFASTTVLCFYDFSNLEENIHVRGLKFTDFVYGVLNRHDVRNISLFKLDLSYGFYDRHDINSWISSAIRRNVRKVLLDLHFPMVVDGVGAKSLVPDLFTCNTLVDLFLGGVFDLGVPESAYLPNLKTCRLSGTGIKFNDDGSTQRLFSNFPKLEKLSFLGCNMRDITNLELHIPSLKTLVFFMVHGEILLNVPNLEYFEWTCPRATFFFKGVWKSIIRANITLEHDYGIAKEYMSQLVNNLIEVKYLSVWGINEVTSTFLLLAADV